MRRLKSDYVLDAVGCVARRVDDAAVCRRDRVFCVCVSKGRDGGRVGWARVSLCDWSEMGGDRGDGG